MTEPQQTDGQQPDPEGQRIRSLDEQNQRIGGLEAEQKRQGGILDEIREAITGAGPKASGSGTSPSTDSSQDLSGRSITEQVRQGVAEIEERKRREQADEEGKAWRKNVDDHLAEHKPREPRTGFRAKMERAIHGKEPER